MLTDTARFKIVESDVTKGFHVVDNGVLDPCLFPAYEQAERWIHSVLKCEELKFRASNYDRLLEVLKS